MKVSELFRSNLASIGAAWKRKATVRKCRGVRRGDEFAGGGSTYCGYSHDRSVLCALACKGTLEHEIERPKRDSRRKRDVGL